MLARALGWAVLVVLAGCRGFGLVGVVERETPIFVDAGQPGEGSVDAALSDAGVLPDAAASGTTPIDECGPDNPAAFPLTRSRRCAAGLTVSLPSATSIPMKARSFRAA